VIGWSNSQLTNDRTIGDQLLSEGLDYIQSLELSAGDRLELPAGVLHNAVVGSRGVVCYESQIKKESIK